MKHEEVEVEVPLDDAARPLRAVAVVLAVLVVELQSAGTVRVFKMVGFVAHLCFLPPNRKH